MRRRIWGGYRNRLTDSVCERRTGVMESVGQKPVTPELRKETEKKYLLAVLPAHGYLFLTLASNLAEADVLHSIYEQVPAALWHCFP